MLCAGFDIILVARRNALLLLLWGKHAFIPISIKGQGMARQGKASSRAIKGPQNAIFDAWLLRSMTASLLLWLVIAPSYAYREQGRCDAIVWGCTMVCELSDAMLSFFLSTSSVAAK